ncbi:MAG: DUF5777 family beta-barrel protein [bacterium]
MTLLLLLLSVFPGERIATLPTGRLLEDGTWQFGISHRFLSAADNSVLEGNLLNFLRNANVLVTFDRGIGGRVGAGAWFSNEPNKEVGLRAAYAPTHWTTLYAGVGANVVEFAADNAFANLALAVPLTFAERIHLLAMPRVTTNLAGTDNLFVSLGLGAQGSLGQGFSLGLEAEPVLLGPDPGPEAPPRLLAWNLALDKQVGWHNFTLVAGNSWAQTAPYWFSAANRDILKGRFRVGFNILRKF